jgi:protein involved in polysaccharide export with SLBB domain
METRNTPSRGFKAGVLKRGTGALLALSILFGQPSLAMAQSIGLMNSGAVSTTKEAQPSNSSIRVSPDAFKQLTPQEQEELKRRMQSGQGKMPGSSETQELAPGQSFQDPSAPQGGSTSDSSQGRAEPITTEGLSSFEKILAGSMEPILSNLKQYGYDLFSDAPSTFAPVDDMPVTSDYVVGPGDEIIISAVSPRRSGDYSLTVNRDGTIYYPSIGTLAVAGMPFGKMTTFLTQKIKGNAADMRLSIRMGKLRSIKIFIVGRVKKPGAYTISALSNLSNALISSGGPTKEGSLRNIQVKRGGTVVSTFDFYEFLMSGNSSKDIRLQAGDVIFVPDTGPLVALAGNVKIPAIYELKSKTSLQDALELAGNVTPQADLKKIQIERFDANQSKKIFDVDASNAKQAGNTFLQSGDLIKVFSINQKLVNGVFLQGNVERPGWYEIKPGTRISQVIQSSNVLKAESYFDYAQIEREVGITRHVEIVPFDLGKALKKDPKYDIQLNPRDVITIFSLQDFQNIPEVEIHGAVLRPGKYRLYPNMRLAELISLAGGMLPEADRQNAELTRNQVIDSYVKSNRFQVSPADAIKGSEQDNLQLAKDDVVLIHKVPNFHKTWTVEIEGEVMRPGTYSILEGETLSQLLERAGGFTPRAYPAGAHFTREMVKALQQRQMQTLADRIEQSLTSLTFKETDNAKMTASMTAQQELVKRLRNTEASGRIVVDLDTPNRMRQEGHDMVLSHGDKLFVPSRNDTISVLGAVYSPNALRHSQGMTVGDYLNEAGGATAVGDLNNLYVIRADGKVHAVSNYKEGWWIFRKGLLSSELNPGDTIIVPEKVEWVDHWGDFLKNSSAVAQILTSGALLYNTFNR